MRIDAEEKEPVPTRGLTADHTVPPEGNGQPLPIAAGTPVPSMPIRETQISTTPLGPAVEPEATAVSGVFGKFELLKVLPGGGMGVVFQAHDTILHRTVALKRIRGGILAQPEEIQRFHREAQAAAHLKHAHIISIYEIGEHEGQQYFTMAFAEGGSLARHLARFGADPRQAAILMEKIARAVHYAHSHGILHRDLKPANVLLDEHDEPLVSDFGLAKFLDSKVELTQSGQMLGTPAYMAPEQAAGRTSQVAATTDVWALGVILYELLTGRRPFAGSEREELLRRIRSADPPHPRMLRPELDQDLEAIILKCLAKEPAQRYASAGLVADDLARWLHGESILPPPEA